MKLFQASYRALTLRGWAITILVMMGADLLYAQGNLAPPGGPAPTMLTLDQIGAKSDQANTKLDQLNTKADSISANTEKRIPVDASHTATDGTHQFVISTPGSYYLTDNILTTSEAILISGSNVTLDLNGFSIILITGSGKKGITITGSNVVVRNGTIRNWGGAAGIDASTSNTSSFERLSIIACGLGLSCGTSCSVRNCVFDSNVGIGVITGKNSLIEDCVANNNTNGNINVGDQCVVQRCIATNSSTGSGITTGIGCLIEHCLAAHNAFVGILSLSNQLIANCDCDFNGTIGIDTSSSSRLLNNSCKFNGRLGGHSNIHCSSNGNTVEGNFVLGNTGAPAGFLFDSTGNTIIKNIARGNSPNYVVPSGNDAGPISTAAALTSPVGNISD